MNGEKLFDDYVRKKSLGTRVVGTSLPQAVAEELARYLRRLRSFVDSASKRLPRLTPVYSDFVQNPAFNAIAVPAGGMHLIVFFDGIPVITTAVIRRLLADCRVFLNIGDAGKEAAELPLYARIVPNANALSRTLQTVKPNDHCRMVYCYHLQNTVFDFIAAHELTHIAHGHVAYLNAEYGQPMVDEFGWMPGTPEGCRERQTMEMDADFNAARLMMQSIDRLWREHKTLPAPMNEYYADQAAAVYNVSAAICIMCRMFGDKSISGVDTSRSQHPPMRWRQMWILNTFSNYAEQLWGDSVVHSCTEAITQAIADVELGFEAITGGKQAVTGLHEAWGKDGKDFASQLSDCWNQSLKAKLARHAYVEAVPHYGFDFPTVL